MLILDFRTGKMTKLALNFGDIAAVAAPGAFLGTLGAGFGSLVDMLAGTDRRWTKILGLLGLVGGAGLGGLSLYGHYQYYSPKAQTRLFLREVKTPMSEEDMQRTFEYRQNEIDAYRQRITTRQPAELISDLVWPTYETRGVWMYKPSTDMFRCARYFVPQKPGDPKSDAIDRALDVAVRARLLALYKEQIPEKLRPEIEKHFINYVNAVIEQSRSPKPNWNVPQPHLNNVVDLLKKANQEELATLVADPYSVLEQKK